MKAEQQANSDPSHQKVIRHRVRENIASLVLSGRYKPGEKLKQQALANAFGVSRGVVREALFELQSLGIVETLDNKGAIVGLNLRNLLHESYELREMLEALVARRCCDHITKAQIRDLEALARQECEWMEEGRWQDGALADREFHQRLMDIAGNSLLLQMSRVFWFVRKSVRENVHDPRKTLDDHLSILSAIGSADPERAERAMREHIRRGGTQVAQALADPTAVRWVVDAPDGAVTPDMECGYGRP